MPINYDQLIPGNAALPGYAIAKQLAIDTVYLYSSVRGVGVGIGDMSCCAALATVPNAVAGYPALAGFTYGGVFGNSQLAAGGLVQPIVGGHAERAALTAAGSDHILPYIIPGSNNAVLFVELNPCPGCVNWLNGGGGGVANPYNGIINGAGVITLNVWYRWPYPAGVILMNAFHNLPVAAQIANINTW